MQWMVRFFKKKSEKWKVAAYSPNISSGAKAYALHREYWWKAMSIKSDTVFKNTSVDYNTSYMISICQSSNCGMLTADCIYPVKSDPP